MSDWHKIRDELEEVTFTLGIYENRLLLEIAKRLKFGQDEFGEFDEEKLKQPRWSKEASQEIQDALVYNGIRLLALEDKDKEK